MSEQPALGKSQKPQAAWLCFQCGADFRHWTELPFEDRKAFLMAHREFHIEHLLEDRCPRCDTPLTVAAAQTDHRTAPFYRVH